MHTKSLGYVFVALIASGLLAACGGGNAVSSQTLLSGETTQNPPGTGTDNGSTPSPPTTPSVPSTPSTAAPTPPTKADLDAAWKAVLTEVGTPTASTASQCAAVSVGAKACGGPTGYLVYSRQVSDESRLLSLVASYTDLMRKWNQANQVISDCSMVMPPQSLVVVDGICRAGMN